MVASVITFSEVKGSPAVRIELPALLPIGERITLRLSLRRRNGARTEELSIDGEFRVVASSVDASRGAPKQILSVEATKLAPAWKAIRNPPNKRNLSPTKTHFVVEE